MTRLLFALALATAVAAGEDEWTRHDLEGGVILAVQQDPLDASHLIAWGPGVVQYASTDGGEHWLPLHPPTPEGWDPHDYLLYYAGPGRLWRSFASAVYYSTDWGTTWQHEKAYAGCSVVGIAPGGKADAEPLVVLAENSGAGQVVFRSARGWRDPEPAQFCTWKPTKEGADPQLRCVCADPNHSDRYACLIGESQTDACEIATTDDGGRHWRRRPQELPLGQVRWDPRGGGVLLACESTIAEGGAHGLLRSTDGGASWTPILWEIKGTRIRALAASPDGDRLYLAADDRGVLIVEGDRVTEANEGLGHNRCCAIAVVSDETLVAGTHLGLFRSTDGAKTWKRASAGIANLQVEHMWFDNGGRCGLWDFTSGFRFSEDGGTRWRATPPPEGLPHTYQMHGAPGSFVALCEDGLHFSDDAKSWIPVNGVPNRIESVAWVSGSEFYCLDAEGMAHHTEDGRKWAACAPFPDGRKLEGPFLCAREGILIAGDASGFLRSTDKGATWKWRPVSVPSGGLGGARVVGEALLLMSQTRVTRIDMASGAVSKFYELADSRDYLAGVWVSKDDPKRCLVAGGPKYLAYTVDGGASWTDLAGELPYNIRSGPWVCPDGRAFVNAGGTLYSRPLPK